MATHKFQVELTQDSALPRDRIINTFHLDDHGVFSDTEQLCEDAAGVFGVFYGPGKELKVTAYPTGPPPNYPVASFTRNVGAAPAASISPRETALCLSYYGERNLPRTRGRLYLCVAAAANVTPNNIRPTAIAAGHALDLGEGIANLGGLDVDWITWSTIDGAHEPVKHMWVDDEWDTQRGRGLRATQRYTRDVDE